jgi:hypothetical protein
MKPLRGAHWLSEGTRILFSQIGAAAQGPSGQSVAMAKLYPALAISSARAMSGYKAAQCASFSLEASAMRLRGRKPVELVLPTLVVNLQHKFVGNR